MSAFLRSSQQIFCQTSRSLYLTSCRHNSNKAAVSRTNRSIYARSYPTMIVQPDGSTITIRYHEPRKIIKLPLDLSTLSEEEKQKRILKRKPKKKIVVQDDIEDDFDVNRYSHLWKK